MDDNVEDGWISGAVVDGRLVLVSYKSRLSVLRPGYGCVRAISSVYLGLGAAPYSSDSSLGNALLSSTPCHVHGSIPTPWVQCESFPLSAVQAAPSSATRYPLHLPLLLWGGGKGCGSYGNCFCDAEMAVPQGALADGPFPSPSDRSGGHIFVCTPAAAANSNAGRPSASYL